MTRTELLEILERHRKWLAGEAGVQRAGGSAKIRSKTFSGIARAMARQWAGETNV